MSEWLAERGIALLLFIAYSAVLLWNGRYGAKVSQDATDYIVGGRRMGGLVIGVSFFATYASTNSYVGNAGKSWEYGAPWLLKVGLMLVFACLSWTTIAPRLWRAVGLWQSLTLPEFFFRRFNSTPVRRLSALIVVFAGLMYMTAIYKGGGHVISLFFGVPYEMAVLLLLAIVVLYTAAGGFVSVVRTDFLQGMIMLVASVVIFAYVFNGAGGFDGLRQLQQAPQTQSLFTWDAAMPFPVLFGIMLVGAMKLMVEPRQLSRFYALQDEQAMRTGFLVSLAGIVIIMGCLFPVGLLARGILPAVSESDLVVPLLVTSDLFPPLIADFLIVALMAAAMSSLDSVLLVTASVVGRDLLGHESREAVRQVRGVRILVVVLAVVSALIALRPPGGIVELTIFSGSLYAGCFFPALVLGLYWRGGNATAAFGSMLAGVIVVAGWQWTGLRSVTHEIVPAMVSSFSAYWLLSVLHGRVASKQVADYFALLTGNGVIPQR